MERIRRSCARVGPASHSTHTSFPVSPMGIFKLTIRSQYMRGLPFLLRKDESQTMVPQSIDTVELWQFVIATLFILPRVLLQVFIGSRIAVLSGGKKTDSYTTMINAFLVIGGVVLSMLSSWLVYSLVQKHMSFKELPSGMDETDTEALNDVDEAAPFLADAS